MPVTSKEKRGRLEDAWDTANPGEGQAALSLRNVLRGLEKSARAAIAGGSIQSTAANGQTSTFFAYGQGQITPLEVAELYRDLVDAFDNAFVFLTQCSTYGLDAFQVEMQQMPSGLAAVASPVIVDNSGRWALLCEQFGKTASLVVGAAINDLTVWLWLMYHTVPVLEARSDYGQMRVGEGAQFT